MDISKIIKYASIGVAAIGAGVGIYILPKNAKKRKKQKRPLPKKKLER